MRGKKYREARFIGDPMDKINPQIIRQLIFEIVEEEFGGDRGLASIKFKLKNPTKGNYRPFTKDSLTNIIDDRTAIKYCHLEAIANYYNLPTFMLLLFSRIRSELEKSSHVFAEDVFEIQYLVRFLSDIEVSVNSCAFRPWDLKQWSHRYSEGKLPL